GVQAEAGLLGDDVRELNLGFEKRMTTARPRVRVKIAASLDGRVALANGASRWITGEAARADVQRLRAESSAVLTGIETVLADDPQLNVRDPAIDLLGRQPLRVVLDSRLRMPHAARMLEAEGEVLVFAAQEHLGSAAKLEAAGVKVLAGPPAEDGRIALAHVLEELGGRQCNDVLVEAGPTLTGQFLQLGLADELIVYLAPVILGPDARPMAVIADLNRLEDAARYTLKDMRRVGDDVKLVFRPA
ncbi:MAG: bifunctional diaminohydroxyphosphoribosylaminopyrimidine deaminase/5-amino-6-(5-phosphoribosylamino)uracil reductase RibD, partial [Steroidobacteraceae bacterium]